jgi:hypothetical protein
MNRICKKCGGVDIDNLGRCRPCTAARSRQRWRDIEEGVVEATLGSCPKCGTSDRFKSGKCRKCKGEYDIIRYNLKNKEIGIQCEQFRRDLKIDTFNIYGGCRCELCGEKDLRILSIDHIAGGGRRHRKSLGINGGNPFYRWLRDNKYPSGYRVLCFNCQSIEKERLRINSGTKDAIRSRRYRYDLKIETLNAYGGCVCAICSNQVIQVLTIDHVDGGGNQHRKGLDLNSGWIFYSYLKNINFPDKDKYRVLCMNCQIKTK